MLDGSDQLVNKTKKMQNHKLPLMIWFLFDKTCLFVHLKLRYTVMVSYFLN